MAESSELISFIASMTGESNLRVEENLGEGYVRLRVSEAERRQAKHDIQHVEDIVIEALRNARDAGARSIYLAFGKTDSKRSILLLDDGAGIPAYMQDRVFDARVTSKLESMHMDRWGVHGRGMALFSIRQNCVEARVVSSAPGKGSAFFFVADTDELPERADQSTWPTVSKSEDGVLACTRGPHNIIRAASEFALEERQGCDVYIGSYSEIAATMYAHASRSLEASRLLFIDDPSDLPVVTRLGFATDAAEFIDIAATLGIEISERTAHRILSGSIAPVRSVASRLLRLHEPAPKADQVDLTADRRGLKLSKDDMSAFQRSMERDFSYLAERYYLQLSSEPKIRVHKDRITVTFEIDKD